MYQSRVFEAHELSNEQYHAEKEHVSGSFLTTLLNYCPAKAKFSKPKDASHFTFGTTAHTNILEQERFDAEYIRMPDQSEFKDLITSEAGIKSFLKAEGVAGYSSKPLDELLRMVDATGKNPAIWHRVVKDVEERAKGRIIVPGKDFDRVQAMRDVVLNNGPMREVVLSGVPELSLFTILNGVKVKVRLDRVTADACIVDYKSTKSAERREFGRHALNLGYWLKMALQHDVFTTVYGYAPTAVKLLAQEKEDPFLAKMYRLTEFQLNEGRKQYQAALALYKRCLESDVWPTYGLSNEEEELHTPEFYKAK
ncbi:exonuclease VIII [Xanthomonas phage vB_XveM_DIBBI]|uniref:Putative exodeoxyribonuclease VIII n=1 Tax=Xanthomonas phage vB_XveM_DIBBI TaxID=1129194 RepID=I3PGW6_9CAUD|nr:exonuclease VIII [Xanthomonas phage vB_XveM_DIBBI]AEX65701.1 putative exodeoxyribonuclease VIII [Xanthomonas phage vB_XveM_DIBBI]